MQGEAVSSLETTYKLCPFARMLRADYSIVWGALLQELKSIARRSSRNLASTIQLVCIGVGRPRRGDESGPKNSLNKQFVCQITPLNWRKAAARKSPRDHRLFYASNRKVISHSFLPSFIFGGRHSLGRRFVPSPDSQILAVVARHTSSYRG